MVNYSSSILGMIARHVTAVLAVVVCNVVLTTAQSAPSAALIKLLSSKPIHDLTQYDLSQLSDLDPDFSAQASMDTDDLSWPRPSLAKIDELRRSRSGWEKDAQPDDGNDVGMTSHIKRFHPTAFFGSRGKRRHASPRRGLPERVDTGFVGSRGKRTPARGESEDLALAESKRFDPSGFAGSRGKRYIPGLEAFLLSQVYQKLDAEKWKRQSMLGFHASRG